MIFPRHTYKLGRHTYKLGRHTYKLGKHTYMLGEHTYIHVRLFKHAYTFEFSYAPPTWLGRSLLVIFAEAATKLSDDETIRLARE